MADVEQPSIAELRERVAVCNHCALVGIEPPAGLKGAREQLHAAEEAEREHERSAEAQAFVTICLEYHDAKAARDAAISEIATLEAELEAAAADVDVEWERTANEAQSRAQISGGHAFDAATRRMQADPRFEAVARRNGIVAAIAAAKIRHNAAADAVARIEQSQPVVRVVDDRTLSKLARVARKSDTCES
jgi:hypothetical protein